MRVLFWVTLVVAFAVAPVLGQAAHGGVTGRVIDETGGVLPGVVVTLQMAAGTSSLQTLTDQTTATTRAGRR